MLTEESHQWSALDRGVSNENMKIGFLGAGRMAQALARGFISAGLTNGSHIRASCAPDDPVSFEEFQKIGATVGHCNKEVVKASDIAIIAVKPNVVGTVVQDVKEVFTNEKLLLSVAMGVPIKKIEKGLSEGSRVIRVMPNTPALVGKGATVIAAGSQATQKDINQAIKLFSAVGICHQVPEYHFDTVTALSGSGPAYIYVVIESLAAGGVRMGLPWDLAYKLSAQTVLGAATMVTETGEHPSVLRDNVTSPAGSTAEGLYQLEKGKMRATLISAIEEATKLCHQNSKNNI